MATCGVCGSTLEGVPVIDGRIACTSCGAERVIVDATGADEASPDQQGSDDQAARDEHVHTDG